LSHSLVNHRRRGHVFMHNGRSVGLSPNGRAVLAAATRQLQNSSGHGRRNQVSTTWMRLKAGGSDNIRERIRVKYFLRIKIIVAVVTGASRALASNLRGFSGAGRGGTGYVGGVARSDLADTGRGRVKRGGGGCPRPNADLGTGTNGIGLMD